MTPSQTPEVTELINSRDIQSAVTAMGKRISDDYQGRTITLVGVLAGSIIFVADLMRSITVPLRLALIQASSYRGPATTPGDVTLDTRMLYGIEGEHVLLVDDILDTGRTLGSLLTEIKKHRPASVRTAMLLWKQTRTQIELAPDYHAFIIPDVFVVGYGLDYNNMYRHLPYIGTLAELNSQP